MTVMANAIAYTRTLGGEDTERSRCAQEATIRRFSERANYKIVCVVHDEDLPESTLIFMRPGFSIVPETITSMGVTAIIVATPNRFSRDLMAQEIGFQELRRRGVDLVAADFPDRFLGDTPTADLVRQILAAVSQYQLAMGKG